MYRYAVGERYEDLISEEGIRFDMSDLHHKRPAKIFGD